RKKVVKPAEKVKIDAPELEGPKILGRIDLDKKPKKEDLKEEVPAVEAVQTAKTDITTPVEPVEEVQLHTLK
ncbi:MAG TPA: hypothetical protein DCF44_01055, partial [Chitinophagaceae bacterium]|nr:hypothetical protein [Chitinophagaceae bacterium]